MLGRLTSIAMVLPNLGYLIFCCCFCTRVFWITTGGRCVCGDGNGNGSGSGGDGGIGDMTDDRCA